MQWNKLAHDALVDSIARPANVGLPVLPAAESPRPLRQHPVTALDYVNALPEDARRSLQRYSAQATRHHQLMADGQERVRVLSQHLTAMRATAPPMPVQPPVRLNDTGHTGKGPRVDVVPVASASCWATCCGMRPLPPPPRTALPAAAALPMVIQIPPALATLHHKTASQLSTPLRTGDLERVSTAAREGGLRSTQGGSLPLFLTPIRAMGHHDSCKELGGTRHALGRLSAPQLAGHRPTGHPSAHHRLLADAGPLPGQVGSFGGAAGGLQLGSLSSQQGRDPQLLQPLQARAPGTPAALLQPLQPQATQTEHLGTFSFAHPGTGAVPQTPSAAAVPPLAPAFPSAASASAAAATGIERTVGAGLPECKASMPQAPEAVGALACVPPAIPPPHPFARQVAAPAALPVQAASCSGSSTATGTVPGVDLSSTVPALDMSHYQMPEALAQITRIQAVQRGRLARKQAAGIKELKAQAGLHLQQAQASTCPSTKLALPVPVSSQQGVLQAQNLDLEQYQTPEALAKITKIQAAHRARQARKKVAGMRPQAAIQPKDAHDKPSSALPAVLMAMPAAGAGTMLTAATALETASPAIDLSDFQTPEALAKITKIQAAQRARQARKEVAGMRSAAASQSKDAHARPFSALPVMPVAAPAVGA